VAELDVRRLYWNQIEVLGSTLASDSEFSDMLRMVAGRQLRPVIDRTYSLGDGRASLEYLQKQDQFGKVILDIAGESSGRDPSDR
jgi:NADPH:quinone reductase-like Zn-dependent oxidoreductase